MGRWALDGELLLGVVLLVLLAAAVIASFFAEFIADAIGVFLIHDPPWGRPFY